MDPEEGGCPQTGLGKLSHGGRQGTLRGKGVPKGGWVNSPKADV